MVLALWGLCQIDSVVLNNIAPTGADLYNLGSARLSDSSVGVIGP